MTESGWQRRCALCGACDADHAYEAPETDEDAWRCPRCEAVRFLWEAVAGGPAQAEPKPARRRRAS